MWILGYGSLMSAYGIGPQAGAVRDLWPARATGRRGFALPTPSRGTIAMDLAHAGDPPRAIYEAVRGDEALGDAPSIGAMLLLLDAAATVPLARREGYPEPAWRRLLDAAGPRGLPVLLLDLARGTGDDVLAYRRALREVGGPSDLETYHYVPHPVLTDAEPALCFVSPERGETGDSTCGAAKACTPHLRPLRLDRLYADAPRAMSTFNPEAQATYVDKCLRAVAHGICLRDLLGDGLVEGDATAKLFAAWRRDPSVLEGEREALRALVPAIRERAAYARRFPQAGAFIL